METHITIGIKLEGNVRVGSEVFDHIRFFYTEGFAVSAKFFPTSANFLCNARVRPVISVEVRGQRITLWLNLTLNQASLSKRRLDLDLIS